MENTPNASNQSMLTGPLKRFSENDPTLRLNRLAQSLHSTEFSLEDESSVSVVRRRDNKNKITIGTRPWSADAISRWNIGTTDKNEQILIKLSHELAHAYQNEKGYEQALIDFLNGSNNIPADKIPYIELYALLSGIGPINGLVQEPIYAHQSQSTGDLKMETLEDITELISTYIISDEYFLYRLENSVTNLSHEQKEVVARKVIEVCKELD
jgi:hypothetical protein